MSGKTIGTAMNYGFAGSYARQPGMVINTKPNVASTPIPFGAPLMQGTKGVQFPTGSFTATSFVGIAASQIQSSLKYNAQNDAGEYLQNEPVPVFQCGRINVKVADGTPAMYGTVYVRIVASGTKKIGDFECTSDTTTSEGTTTYNNIALTNCQWGGPKDANGVAELVIFTGIGA